MIETWSLAVNFQIGDLNVLEVTTQIEGSKYGRLFPSIRRSHSQNHIPDFLPRFHVIVSFHDLIKIINPID